MAQVGVVGGRLVADSRQPAAIGPTKYINDVSKLTFHYVGICFGLNGERVHRSCGAFQMHLGYPGDCALAKHILDRGAPSILGLRLANMSPVNQSTSAIGRYALLSTDRRFQLISSIDFNTHQTSMSKKGSKNKMADP